MKTRGPVLRPGRARFFTHALGLADKISIATYALQPATDAERQVVADAVHSFEGEPVSLWRGVADELDKTRRAALFDAFGDDMKALRNGMREREPLTRERLGAAIVARLTTGRAGNFL